MWERMETWLFRPVKSMLSYCRDSCYTRKKPRIKKSADNSYISNCTGTSTKNIVKLLVLSETVITASASQIPPLFFKDNLGQTFLFAFDQSASSSGIDLTALNKTVGIINNEILSQCNVNSTTIFKYTPQIITTLSCTLQKGELARDSIVFNLISDKTISQTLIDCIKKKIFNNFDWCGEDPRTLGLVLGIVFGILGPFAIIGLGYLLYLNRTKIKTKIKESYLRIRYIVSPRVEIFPITLHDNPVINDPDETTALVILR